MVDELERLGFFATPECIAAFRKVDRGDFWVAGANETAYLDMPLRNGRLHQSAPHIYARALESLLPMRAGMSFLNIGSGTGYFSSIVAELIGDDAVNDGIDIWPETVAHASRSCRKHGRKNIEFTLGNVYELDVDQGMRYDRIYVGACANSRSKYFYSLLEVGGVLVGPFQAGHSQQLRRVVRESETYFAVELLSSVQFATLVEPVPTTVAVPSSPEAVCGTTLGLPGVPFTFSLRDRCWTPERNSLYPASYQNVVITVLNGRPYDIFKACLPPDMWAKHILPMCSRNWFEPLKGEGNEDAVRTVPSQVRSAFSMVNRVAQKALAFRRPSSLGDADDNSDLQSTSFESSASQPTLTRDSTRSDRSDGDLLSPAQRADGLQVVLYEALSNGPPHAIGVGGDPDDLDDERPGLMAALLEARTRANPQPLTAAPQVEDPADDEETGRGPRRIWQRCAYLCRAVARRIIRRGRPAAEPPATILEQRQQPVGLP